MNNNNMLKEYIKALILEKLSDNPDFNPQVPPDAPQEQPESPVKKRTTGDMRQRQGIENRRPEKKKRTFEMPKLSDNPKVKDAQEYIYVMKRRIGDLDVVSSLAKVKKSYDDFNNRVTKYDTNKHEILKYLVLLKSNATALMGILESISTECEELENKLKD